MPPADIAVVVPTMDRRDNPPRLMTSLRLSGARDRCRVWFVVEADDDVQADICARAGGTVLRHSGTWSVKSNHAWRVVDDEQRPQWVLVVGDDVYFHPGWLEAALRAAEERGLDVVGTNDLLNPRTLAGLHACHIMFRASYIRERGASWDGPGTVFTEALFHSYTDDEAVKVAMDRGVFGVALDSVVEHFHVLNGKAPMDEGYAAALDVEKMRADAAVFVQREARFGKRT